MFLNGQQTILSSPQKNNETVTSAAWRLSRTTDSLFFWVVAFTSGWCSSKWPVLLSIAESDTYILRLKCQLIGCKLFLKVILPSRCYVTQSCHFCHVWWVQTRASPQNNFWLDFDLFAWEADTVTFSLGTPFMSVFSPALCLMVWILLATHSKTTQRLVQFVWRSYHTPTGLKTKQSCLKGHKVRETLFQLNKSRNKLCQSSSSHTNLSPLTYLLRLSFATSSSFLETTFHEFLKLNSCLYVSKGSLESTFLGASSLRLGAGEESPSFSEDCKQPIASGMSCFQMTMSSISDCSLLIEEKWIFLNCPQFLDKICILRLL